MNKTLLALGALSLTGCNTIDRLLNKQNINYDIDTATVYYQAYDWQFDSPSANPIFETFEEAEAYANGNNVSGGQSTGHQYIVRRVSHRYEVRLQDDVADDVMFTSTELEPAEEYVNAYSKSHSDLFIYDLVNGDVVDVNTP